MNQKMYLECALSLGRNHAPTLLFDLVWGDVLKLSPDTASVVVSAWSGAEFPEGALGPGEWIDYFTRVGYTHDGQAAERPTRPVTLFRGCVPEPTVDEETDERSAGGRFGMSWTTDLELARRYAHDGLGGRPAGNVYTTTVEPQYLLAYIGESERDESEFVVNPRRLTNDTVVRMAVRPRTAFCRSAPTGSGYR